MYLNRWIGPCILASFKNERAVDIHNNVINVNLSTFEYFLKFFRSNKIIDHTKNCTKKTVIQLVFIHLPPLQPHQKEVLLVDQYSQVF